VVFARDKHDLSSFAIAFPRQLHSKFSGATQGKDDGDMSLVHIQIRTVAKACTGMRRGAEAAHLADGERAHNGRAISCSSANDLDIGRAATEGLKFFAAGKDASPDRWRRTAPRALHLFANRGQASPMRE
jgi:hypothetical protein